LDLLSAILSDIDVLNVPWTAVTAHGIAVWSRFFYFLFVYIYIYIFFNWNGLRSVLSRFVC